jgi:serine acetyltransferase
VAVGEDVIVGAGVTVFVAVGVADGTGAGAQAVRIKTRKNNATFFILSSSCKMEDPYDTITVAWDMPHTK